MKKRMLAMLLTASLCINTFGSSVFAAEPADAPEAAQTLEEPDVPETSQGSQTSQGTQVSQDPQSSQAPDASQTVKEPDAADESKTDSEGAAESENAESVSEEKETEVEESVTEQAANAIACSQERAVGWIREKADTAWRDSDGNTQCVDLIYAYMDYLVGWHVGGHAIDFSNNSLPGGFYRAYDGPQPGDIVVWNRSANMGSGTAHETYGHIGLVAGVNPDGTIQTVETNTDENYQNAVYKTRITSGVACYVRPEFDNEPPVISSTIIVKPNSYGGFTVSYEISDNVGIGSYSTGIRLYGYRVDQETRIDNRGLGADGRTVTLDVNPADYNGFDGIYNVSVQVTDLAGNGAIAQTTPGHSLDLYKCTADKKEIGTFKVTKDNAPVRNSPYAEMNGKSTSIANLKKGEKVEIIGKFENLRGNDWYRMASGNWIYSGNIQRVTTWNSIIDTLTDLIKMAGHPTFYKWGDNLVVTSTTTSAKQYSSANIQMRVEQYTVGNEISASSYADVTFDPNGGSCSSLTGEYRAGTAFGYLPSAYRFGYTFDGWFTSPEGGSQITSASIFSGSGLTLYAHWTRIILLEGDCGPNLHFVLYGDGELEITGSGEMTSHPWTDERYRNSVLEVTFPEGITKLPMAAFGYCHNLGKISIPDAVTAIGESAFRCCERLESVKLPAGLSIIEGQTFAFCSELEQITLPDTVTVIRGGAFGRCTSLANINLPARLEQLDAEAFFDCDLITEVTIPKTLVKSDHTYIYDFVYDFQTGPFYGCDNLKTVHFEDGCTSVCTNLFANCPGLNQITIPESVKTIEDGAFRNCTGLVSVTLPEGLEQIKYLSFGNCTSLVAIDIPDSVTRIWGGAFGRCSSLTRAKLPLSLKQIDAEAFFDCDGLTEITVPPAVEKSDGVYIYDFIYDYQIGPFYGCDGLKTVKFAEGTTRIGAGFFANCPGLEKIQLPDGITTIGANAFNNCDGLTELTLPKSVTSCGYEGCIQNCDNLKLVSFEEGTVKIVENLLRDCSAKAVQLPESLEVIGKGAFRGCPNLTELTLPEHVKSIGVEAFYDCRKLSSVQLPSGLEEIGNVAFANTALMDVTIPSGVVRMPDAYGSGYGWSEGIFRSCESLKTVRFQEGTVKILANLMKNCPVETVELPESLEIIEHDAFRNCPNLTEITIPDRVKSIGVAAFYDCQKLSSVQLPAGLEEIGNVAFANTALTEITIPAGVVRMADAYGTGFGWSEGVFRGCQNLKKATIQEGAVTVVSVLFKNCPALEEIVLPETVASIGNAAFASCGSLKTVVIPAATTDIRADAFNDSPNVTIYGYTGSRAEAFAREHEIPFADAAALTQLVITAQPVAVTAGLNTKISFSVNAENAASYQWQYSKDGKKWTNSTAASAKTEEVSITVSKSNYQNTYRCKVTGKDGTVICSDAVGIDLIPWVNVLQHPESPAMIKGETVNFHVEAEYVADGGYQWQYSKDGKSWFKSTASGYNTDTLSIKVSSTNLSNMYRCAMTGIDGNKTYSNAAVFVILAEQPQPSTARIGEYATFSLNTEGVETYQWQYSDDGKKWYTSTASGATTATIRFKATSTNHGRVYRCKLLTTTGVYAYTKPVGFAEGLKIVKQPENVTAEIGEKVTFTVEATGVDSYQWQYSKDGKTWYKSSATGNAGASLQITVSEANKNNVYRCKLTGANGSTMLTSSAGATIGH